MRCKSWAIVLLAASSAAAHDLWLIPPETATKNAAANIRAVSGSVFPVGDHAPDPARFHRSRAIGPDGAEIVLHPRGTQSDPPAGLLEVTPTKDGVWVVAVETAPKLITLEPDAFNHYLISDGLLPVWLQRAKDKQLDRPGRERYSKSPKALMRIGAAGGDATRALGLPLEIVPLRDPFAARVGETLAVRVLFHGKPLTEALLGYCRPNDGEIPRATIRTDENGEALIPLSRAGLTTIRLTHMTRPQKPEYEWESFWTTLTFRLP